jgi:phospholipase/lecithinase/hemolysin
MPARRIFALLLLSASVAWGGAAAAKPTALYVFGDSLVDAGNLDLAVGSDVFNPAAQGYFQGRFTNGPVYTDLLNHRLFGDLAAPSLAGGNNYAFADARAVANGDGIPDLGVQLGAYFSDAGGLADPNALYVLNFGGNDVFGLEDNDIGGLIPAAYSALFTSNILDAVQQLNAAGARNVLVAGVPVLDPVGAALDGELQAGLDSIDTSFIGHLRRLDYLGLYPALITDPAAFGLPAFVDISNPCKDARPVVGGAVDCSGYLFFDDVHPTAEVQAAIYRQVVGITGVPEPADWALMILGLGLTGAALRTRGAAEVNA